MSAAGKSVGPLGLPIQQAASLASNVDVKRTGNTAMAYASTTTQFTRKLAVTAGMRLDVQDIDPVHVNDVGPRLQARYQLSDNWQLLFDAGRYIQQQQLFEIQTGDGKLELDPPQHSDQVNVGLAWQLPALTVRLDTYYREINSPWSRYENLYNRWVLFPELQGDRYLVSARNSRATGSEISLKWHSESVLGWHLNYAYSDTKDRIGSSWRPRAWHQRHTANAGARWQNAGWRLGVTASYHSGWPTTSRVTDSSQLPAQIYNRQLPAYFSLNTHISRLFKSQRGQLEVYLDVTNLTNRDNPGGYVYLLDGSREANLLLPRLPSIGLSWHW